MTTECDIQPSYVGGIRTESHSETGTPPHTFSENITHRRASHERKKISKNKKLKSGVGLVERYKNASLKAKKKKKSSVEQKSYPCMINKPVNKPGEINL